MRFDENLTFFTSDTHFRHKSILRYQPNRKFDDIHHMDEMLIKHWNETVPAEATVIHHGDFAFASKNNIRKYRERLNGRIILILGNHDYKSELVDIFGHENIRDAYFYSVGDQDIHSCHYPMASWKNAEEGSWNLHGHYHGHEVDEKLYKRKDVGIDTHPLLRPYSYPELNAFMSTRTARPIRHPE